MPIRSPYKMKEKVTVSEEVGYLFLTGNPEIVAWMDDARNEIYHALYLAALAVQKRRWAISEATVLSNDYVVYIRNILQEFEQINSDFSKVASGEEKLQSFIDKIEDCIFDNKKYLDL